MESQPPPAAIPTFINTKPDQPASIRVYVLVKLKLTPSTGRPNNKEFCGMIHVKKQEGLTWSEEHEILCNKLYDVVERALVSLKWDEAWIKHVFDRPHETPEDHVSRLVDSGTKFTHLPRTEPPMLKNIVTKLCFLPADTTPYFLSKIYRSLKDEDTIVVKMKWHPSTKPLGPEEEIDVNMLP